jgi:7-cyano-7-deazaguanine synthase
MIRRKAIVLFSGGQDSTTCLAWALDRYDHVETIGFDYGQNHRIELDCRPAILARIREDFPHWAARLGEDHLLEIGVLGKISDTALTQDAEIVLQKDGLPNTSFRAATCYFSSWPRPSHIAATARCWWAACARPTTPGTPTAATAL